MRNIWLIARREYIERVRTRAFVLTTILLPLFIVGVSVLPVYLMSKAGGGKVLAIVSADQRLGDFMVQELRSSYKKQSEDTSSTQKKLPGNKPVVEFYPPSEPTRTTLQQRVEAKQLTGYLWIDPATSKDAQPKATYYSGSSGDFLINAQLSSALRNALFRERLLDTGIDKDAIDKLNAEVHIETQSIQNGTTKKKSAMGSYFGAYIMMMLLYVSVILYGMNVSRSIIEEKTTRVFEVLLSTLRPIDLMFGKIIGVGAVGLTQIGAWVLMGAAALSYPMLIYMMQKNDFSLNIGPAQLVYFLIFFVLGYLFYSAMSAALGASVNSDRELQQLSMIVTGPLIAAIVCLNYVVASPDSTTSQWLSLFPPFTPLLMYLRISVSAVPVWQIALSIALLAASTVFMILICSRIYRVGILMYGKRPTLPELLRWLRYS
jgi:ABC-2 type transport system permease protein